MGLFCTVLPGWAMALAIARLGATRAANIGTLGPVITIALGWWLLAEPFSWLQLAGMALVLAGVSALKR
jgi:drug/metabolite transporter (DMT)-like permease